LTWLLAARQGGSCGWVGGVVEGPVSLANI
jgi:hypothetical protein